jgi:hypothetical protein
VAPHYPSPTGCRIALQMMITISFSVRDIGCFTVSAFMACFVASWDRARVQQRRAYFCSCAAGISLPFLPRYPLANARGFSRYSEESLHVHRQQRPIGTKTESIHPCYMTSSMSPPFL